MVYTAKTLSFRETGIPQRRPYKLNWELALGDVHKGNHLRGFYFHRMREGPADLGNFVTTRFSCLTRWPSFKGKRMGISIGGEDKLNSRRLDIINFTLSTRQGKDAEFYQAYFYHGPGYAKYVSTTISLPNPKPNSVATLPQEFTQVNSVINRDKFPAPREVGRLFLNENQFDNATQASPPKKVRKVSGNYFVPINSLQYPEKEEPVRELFRRFDCLYAFLRAEFRKRKFLTTKPEILDDILWPQFKDAIDFSLENKLIQFQE